MMTNHFPPYKYDFHMKIRRQKCYNQMKMISAARNLLLTKKNQKNNLNPAADSRRSDAASELKLNDE